METSETEELKQRVSDLELQVEGKCPECKMKIKGFKPVFGFFAPEWWESMRQAGLDPANGHALNCSNKNLKLK